MAKIFFAVPAFLFLAAATLPHVPAHAGCIQNGMGAAFSNCFSEYKGATQAVGLPKTGTAQAAALVAPSDLEDGTAEGNTTFVSLRDQVRAPQATGDATPVKGPLLAD